MFQTYFKAIQQLYLSDSESSELTYRTPLEILLKTFEAEYTKRTLTIKQEPKKQEDKGRPDFKVTTKEQMTIGFVETKSIEADLNKHLNSNQLKKYNELSDNIILTDYLTFILIRRGEPILKTEIFAEFNLKKKRFKIDPRRIVELTTLLTEFFQSEPDTIYKTRDLAYKLSIKAEYLRDYSKIVLQSEMEEINLLQGIYEAFKKSLLPLLEKEYFSDIYAQTLTYGLFLAALNCDNPHKDLDKVSAFSLMPSAFPLIKELFHQLEEFPPEIVWAVDEIISILKTTDFAAIKKEFAEYRHKERGFNDPFIYFYEDFLKHYDKSQRELRGVYYTPEPAVSYIIRSINYIIKDKFKLYDGFINKHVTLLDFATGTGTFLLNAFSLAIEEAKKIGDIITVNKILNESIIKNFYGFELLVAPYVIAHLKISEFFKELGLSVLPGNRLNIYLTNTLTNNVPEPFFMMPSLSREGKEANRIKNNEIFVITGNPPYSGHSANVDEWISGLMRAYYQVDGKKLDEKNPKWLQDDYVKFIRFAQWKMEKMDKGVVGIITNHSYLDNPTFRGMRQSLMKTFNEIYILDLHGNAKKKEKSPDGSKDDNIFDIQQGVSIAIFVKDNKSKEHKVYHSELYGLRQAKYNSLLSMELKNTEWNEINPKTPFYLFKPRNEELLGKYNAGYSIKEIFNISSVGVVTSRDEFVIDSDIAKLTERVNEFKNLSIPDYEIQRKYNLKENSKFKISKCRKVIASLPKVEFNKKFCRIHYRPFDVRNIFYDDAVIERLRKDTMVNMSEENIAIVIPRQIKSEFKHIFVTNNLIDFNITGTAGSFGSGYLFPLYILSNGEDKVFFGVKEPEIEYGGTTKSGLHKKDNFTDGFKNFILDKYYGFYTPEQILGYIYAVLHSPAYRTKYIEFLKIDFPRIPFTDDEELFRELSFKGEELIDNHLLTINYTANICSLKGDGIDYKVEKVEYEELKPGENHDSDLLQKVTGEKSGKVWINKERWFEPIPEPIWKFYIGGYQVLEKWLKERKKHEISLSSEDVQHFIKVVNVLDNTIKAMKQIDELTKDWI